MASFLTKAAGAIAGKVGKAIDVVGQATGNRLPEFKVSENLQRIGGMLNPVKTAYASDYSAPIPYAGSQSTPQVLGQSTYQPSYSSSTPSGNQVSNNNAYQQSQSLVNDQTGNQLDQISRDYEDNMRMLGDQEMSAQGQAAETAGTLSAEETKTRNQIANQQAVDTQGQEAQLAQGEKTASSGLQGARDLFRQTQQNNIAQLSGAGLSSSSVAEALAERLGVETARRIAGITGSLGEIRQNATKELSRIKSYYEGKATEVSQWVANQKLAIQNQLSDTLRQIGTAKQMAASAKANARADALASQKQQLFALAQQENQFQNSLKEWAMKKAESTQQLITDPASVLAYNQNIAKLNATPGITQTTIGNYGVNDQGQTGYYAGPLKTSVKKEEDLMSDPFATK